MPRSAAALALVALVMAGCRTAEQVSLGTRPIKTVTVMRRGSNAELAFRRGLLPTTESGAAAFVKAHPSYDGRGVLIAILDSGVDPDTPGLLTATTGAPKLVDVRDFTGEGDVPLAPLTVEPDNRVVIHSPSGDVSIRGLPTGLTALTGGVFDESRLRLSKVSDPNGNEKLDDRYAVVVGRPTTPGDTALVAYVDSDGDGDLSDEQPVRSFRVAHESVPFRDADGQPTLNVALNLSPSMASLVFDGHSHGTHVAGIATGHDIGGVAGFNGLAPGAQVLACKIALASGGGISVTRSMIDALRYAADYGKAHGLRVMANMSFGIGNELEGRAESDRLFDQFLVEHPEFLFVVAAGNEGPGISTVGQQGSTPRALTVGAIFPTVFASGNPALDPLGLATFSNRGGELTKPEVIMPGVAYSTTPPFSDGGGAIKGGTSMAAPNAAGAAALLLSAMVAENRSVTASELKRAMMETAVRTDRFGVLDQGAGVIRVEAAYQRLRREPPHAGMAVHSLDETGAEQPFPAAYFRDRRPPAEQRFRLAPEGPSGAGTYHLRSTAPWIRVADSVVTVTATGPATVGLRYDTMAVRSTGLHVGEVEARLVGSDLVAFRLQSVVVTPEPLSMRQATLRTARHTVAPGALDRYFFTVPAAASALRLRLAVADSAGLDGANLAVSDPAGRSVELETGPETLRLPLADDDTTVVGPTVAATLMGEQLTPGVWEVDVESSPFLGGLPLAYRLEASLSAVAASLSPSEIKLTNRAAAPLTIAAPLGRLIGAEATRTVRFSGTDRLREPITFPAGVDSVELRVEATTELFNQVTDLGIAVLGSDGDALAEENLTYSTKTLRFTLPPDRDPAEPYTLTIRAGFADQIPADWSLELRTRLLGGGGEPQPLGTRSLVLTAAPLTIPRPAASLPFTAPTGFRPIFELHLATPTGATVLDAVLPESR